MIANKNQLGRELLPRLVDDTHVDIEVAMRFFYNSDFYSQLPEGVIDTDPDLLYTRLKQEFETGSRA
jgi:hypothetical protein